MEKKGQPAFQNMLTTSELAPYSTFYPPQMRRVTSKRSEAAYSGMILSIIGGPHYRDDPGRRGDPDHDDRYPHAEAIRRDRGLAR